MDQSRYKRILSILILIPLIILGCADDNNTPVGPDTGQGNSGDSRPFSHTSFPGASAEAFLTDNRFTDLQIEIDYMAGYEPTNEAISRLQTFLEQRLNKSNIAINLSEIPSGGGGTYTLDQIQDLEEDHRNSYTEASGSTLHVYVIILDGKYFQESTIGIAFYNTSSALFGGTIEDITGSPPVTPTREKVEATVLNHEFGHLIGLVGSGSPTQSDHKTEGSSHCTTESCLMEPAIETTNFFENFSGEVPVLDELCIQDLQANGGK